MSLVHGVDPYSSKGHKTAFTYNSYNHDNGLILWGGPIVNVL